MQDKARAGNGAQTASKTFAFQLAACLLGSSLSTFLASGFSPQRTCRCCPPALGSPDIASSRRRAWIEKRRWRTGRRKRGRDLIRIVLNQTVTCGGRETRKKNWVKKKRGRVHKKTAHYRSSKSKKGWWGQVLDLCASEEKVTRLEWGRGKEEKGGGGGRRKRGRGQERTQKMLVVKKNNNNQKITRKTQASWALPSPLFLAAESGASPR